MMILADHNLEGQAILLWSTLAAEGWLDLLTLRLMTLRDVGLPNNSSDREVWRWAQAQQMILLTGNRRMKGANSLEQTIREENTPVSMYNHLFGIHTRTFGRSSGSCSASLSNF